MTDARVHPDRGAYVLSAALLVAGLATHLAVERLPPVRSGISASPLALAVLTLLLSASAIPIQFRRHAQTLSLTELALAIGLFTVSPFALLLSKAFAHAADGVRRRRPLAKNVFNVCVVAFQVPVAVLVFHAALDRAPATGPRAWLAAGAAVGVSNVVSGFAVLAVIAATETEVDRTGVDIAIGLQLVVSIAETALAMVAVAALRGEPHAGWLLALVTVLLLGFTRAYSSLRDRNAELAAVYDFGRAMTEDADDLPALVVAKVRALLRAERAEVVLAYDDTAACWRADEDGVRQVGYDAAAAPAFGHSRDVVAVPLRGEGGVMGLLAAYDRMGNVRRFARVDLHLLEALAAQAGATLESARLVDRLRHEAAHDALTGLPNWTWLRTHVDGAIAHGSPVALLLMDLDRFKDVNDTLGHDHGDDLLVELAGRLRAHLGHGMSAGRLGGDEFAVVLTGVTDDAMRVARDLRDLLAEAVVIEGVRLEMSASIGVALYPEHGGDAASLLQRADVAMYVAKAGHAGVARYEPSLDDRSARRLMLAGELRRALDQGSLVVAYQPKVSLDDGRAVGVEALLRWQHPELGFVPPDEFIPLAEQTGLIVPLTTYVLDRALGTCAGWLATGLDVGVAVNLSVRNLLDGDLPDQIGAQLVRHGVEPRRLTLEITESSVMADPARAVGILDRLSRLGIRLSVDDFGTGYSSLTYLKALPVDEVKIDKSFVLSMANDPGDAAIVRSIIDLSGALGLTVVAEGVEDNDAWARLAEMGCDVVQGYGLARPAPAADTTVWLGAWDPAAAIRRRPRGVADLSRRRRLARGDTTG